MSDGIAGLWRRNWRRVAVLLIAVVVLLLSVRTVAGWWIGRQLGGEIARLQKSYGSLNTNDMNQWVPPLEDRARVMRSAAELTVVDRTNRSSWVFSGGFSAVMTCLTGGDCPAGVTDRMRQFVDQNRLAIYVATRGRTLPRAAWGVHYFRAEMTRMPIGVVDLNMLLAAACRVELEDGRVDGAVEAALTGLASASSMRNEWSLMQVWRMSAVHQQAGCVREMLQRAEPSPRTLSDLAAAFADSRWPDPTRMWLMGEMRIANAWFAELERGRRVEYRWASPSSDSAGPINWLLRPVVSGRHLGDLRAFDRVLQFQALAPWQRDAAHTQSAPSQEELRNTQEWQQSRWPVLKALHTTFLTPWLSTEIDAGWEFHNVLNAAETSVALRRYRLDHGSYPDALSQLVPQYLPWVPLDPFTGRPLEYAKRACGFDLHLHRAKDTSRGFGQAQFDWTIPR